MEREILVGYGIGLYYEYMKNSLPFKLSFLCDRRWQEFGNMHDGIPVISPERLKAMKNAKVLIFSGNDNVCASIENDLRDSGLKYERACRYLTIPYEISGKELKKLAVDNRYSDPCHNEVHFDKTLDDRLRILFKGKNNYLDLKQEIYIGSLYIIFGSNGVCEIGSNTKFHSTTMYISDAKVLIGESCLFAHNTEIRCHDGHHIFNRDTKHRINYPKNVVVGNHVWAGAGARLLPGFEIQDNSVVGAESVSSSKFGRELIIAGNPAKIIREGICWAGDDTSFCQRDNFDECIDRSAEKYFE